MGFYYPPPGVCDLNGVVCAGGYILTFIFYPIYFAPPPPLYRSSESIVTVSVCLFIRVHISKTIHWNQGRESERFLSKNSYLSTTFVIKYMLYLSKNSYLRIFGNPGPGHIFTRG